MQDNKKRGGDETAFTKLAACLGVGRSTVSKVLRHCGGVDTGTRHMILAAAKNVDELRASGTCGIYCILPDIPSFFWQEMQNGISDGIAAAENDAGKEVKCNIYCRLRDEESVLDYLDEAERMDARCIIIATVMTAEIRERLSAICRRADRLVILLSEYGNVPNAFYVGADSYSDGRRMAEMFLEYRKSLSCPVNLCLFNVESNPNVAMRVNGFTDVLSASGIGVTVIPFDFEMYTVKTLQSYTASRLASVTEEADDGSVPVFYIPIGMKVFVQAMNKAGIDSRAACFCHDFSAKEASSDPRIIRICSQNVYEQGREAIRRALEYLNTGTCPDRKKIIVPSSFF